MFQTGGGVLEDPAAAARWYRKAADAGNGYGQMNLALLYVSGLGVERDPVQARHWLEEAQANGFDAVDPRLKALQ